MNEVTINSNNAIQLSRGELLNWVNQLLKTNLAKIEQLGTGAVYCQLADVLYPNKLPMNKVNWKAKYEYQFVANFKLIQQTFTKVSIHKHIEVQKLVKCKYQDNLELLQWFKKIFDNYSLPANYNPLTRREQSRREREKENPNGRASGASLRSREHRSISKDGSLTHSNAHSHALTTSNALNSSKQTTEPHLYDKSHVGSFHLEEQELKLPYSAIKHARSRIAPPGQNSFRVLDSPLKDDIKERAYNEERQFFLRKFKEMEHLMEEWDHSQGSAKLVENLRRVMLVVPEVVWRIEGGRFIETIDTENDSEVKGGEEEPEQGILRLKQSEA